MKTRFHGLGIIALPLSWVYAIGVWLHRFLYVSGICQRYHATKPVIAIGNITVGGVGKTPMTVWVTQFYLSQGLTPVVLLRGYKSHDGVSDEAQLLQELLPGVLVMTGANRQASIEYALAKQHVDIFICDDAFQHWPLMRNLDIVLLDSTYPLGNRMLLPAGILREPVSALQRAGVLVITKSDDEKPALHLMEELRSLQHHALMVRARHRLKGLRDVFTGQAVDFKTQEKVLAVSSIADPDSFVRTLVMMGFKVQAKVVFNDHEPYVEAMIERIRQQVSDSGITKIVTTHKDAVKIKPFQHQLKDLHVVCVDIQMDIIQGKEELERKLLTVMHA